MLNSKQINKFYLAVENQFVRLIGEMKSMFYKNSLYAILIGLPGLALSIERVIKYLNADNNLITKNLYFSWARNYVFPEQRYQILGFITALFVGYLIFLLNLYSPKKENENKKLILISISASLLLDVAPKVGSLTFTAYAVVIWTFLALINIESKLFNSNILYLTIKRIYVSNIFYIALTSIVFGSFVFINSSFIKNQFILYNDNIDLIPFGEIAKSEDKRVNSIKNLYSKISCDQAHNLGVVSLDKKLKEDLSGTKFYLNNDTSTSELCFYGRLTKNDLSYVKHLQPNFSEEKFWEVVKINSEHQEAMDLKFQDSALWRSFEVNKTYEQFENIFHHHFQLLGPYNKYRVLQDTKQVDSIYGMAYLPIGMVLNNFFSPSYEDFIALVFSINILYLLAFIFLISKIFESSKYVAIIALVLTGSMYSLGYVTYFTGLGYNSFRHFFDVFVLYSIFKYLKNGRIFYLILTFIFTYLALFLNLEFGLFP